MTKSDIVDNIKYIFPELNVWFTFFPTLRWSVATKCENCIEAIQVSKEYWQNESIEAIMLCPGFKHGDVAEIFEAVEGKVSINVAGGDGPSSKISMEALKKAGFFPS